MVYYSMLQLDHDLDQLSLTEKSDDSSSSNSPTEPHSAPVTPAHRQERPPITVGYRRATQGGFLEGLLGCLRPVWTIIGKATTAELKQQGEILTSTHAYWYHLVHNGAEKSYFAWELWIWKFLTVISLVYFLKNE